MRKARLLAVGAVLTLVGCGGGDGDDGGGGTGPAVFTALNVTPTSVTVAPNGTQALTASAVDQRGQGMTGLVTQFSSSDQAKATVTNGGVVTGVAIGTATITVTGTIDEMDRDLAAQLMAYTKAVIRLGSNLAEIEKTHRAAVKAVEEEKKKDLDRRRGKAGSSKAAQETEPKPGLVMKDGADVAPTLFDVMTEATQSAEQESRFRDERVSAL